MIKSNKKLILVIILLLAALLRFYNLGTYPALNADEAALAYNAKSLLKTGMDEHGNSWPIHFQSFNDYKPGLYVYLVMPFVAMFGLDVFWLRFPGALAGVITVLVLYYLVGEILRSYHAQKGINDNFENRKWNVGLFASFLLAINPWHIHFSRGAWEVNLATFFITLGVYFFFRALRTKPKMIFSLFILSFCLSLYTYHSARLISPLIGLGLLLIYFNPIRKNARPFLTAILIGLIISLPLLFDIASGAVLSRAAGVGLFADQGPVNRINEQRGQHEEFDGFGSVLLHNKAVNYGLAFLENWGQHYHGEFLFLSGDDIQRNKVPETGQMHFFSILFIPLGFAFVIRKRLKGGVFVLWWLLIAPLAAAFTFQSPHALRSQNMVIPLTILNSFGLYYLLSLLNNKFRRNIYVVCSLFFIVTISWSFLRHQHMYWVHMAKEYPFSSQYGVQELVNYISDNKKENQEVVVTDRYDQPYILFLFYLDYPPEQFQQEHNLTARDKFGFSTVSQFGDYHFRSIQFEDVRKQYPNSLIAGTDEEIPDEANVVQEVYGSNDYKYFQVVAN